MGRVVINTSNEWMKWMVNDFGKSLAERITHKLRFSMEVIPLIVVPDLMIITSKCFPDFVSMFEKSFKMWRQTI